MFVVFLFLTLVAGAGGNALDKFLFSAEDGVVSGMPNAGFAGAIVGGVLVVVGVGCCIYQKKKKANGVKSIPKEIDTYGTPNTKAAAEGKGPGMDDEGDIERHEEQRQRLALHLKYLLSKDANDKSKGQAGKQLNLKARPVLD
nr:hypothetical protein BaRGS_005486 [Batillaria attramentaria]